MQAYSFGLLQLVCELLHCLGVFLSHLLYLGFMGSVLLINSSLQQGHFLFTFGPGRMDHINVYFYKYAMSSVSRLKCAQVNNKGICCSVTPQK